MERLVAHQVVAQFMPFVNNAPHHLFVAGDLAANDKVGDGYV
jgi:hypothetical protein